MKTRLYVYCLLIFIVGCTSPDIDTLKSYKRDFVQSLKKLEIQSEKIDSITQFSFKRLKQVITNTVDFEIIYKKLPVKVQEIHLEFRVLEDKLFYVKKNVDYYFKKMKALDEQLSQKERKKYAFQKERWDKHKNKIFLPIKDINILMHHLEDIRRLLVLAELKKQPGQLKKAIQVVSEIFKEDFKTLKENIKIAYQLIEY